MATNRQRGNWSHWLRAAGAIFDKDLRLFMRYPLNAVMRVIEPVLWIAPAILLSRAFVTGGVNAGFASYTGTTDYTAFLITGGVVSAYVSAVFWGMGFALKGEMDLGVLESNWLMPVPPLVQLIARSLFSLVHTTVNVALIAVIVHRTFGFSLGGRLLPAIASMVPLLAALYGIGLGLAALVLRASNANNFIDIGNFLVTELSGQSFPVAVLPRPLLAISLALPLTYAYDSLRGMLLGTATLLPVALEQLLLLLLAPAAMIAGWIVFQRVERQCRDLGTLARH